MLLPVVLLLCAFAADALDAATLTLSATPLTVEAGSPARLDWAATDATTCEAAGGWTGRRSVRGVEDVTPAATTTYALWCRGPAGDVTKSVTVGVKGDDCEESDVCTLDGPTRSCLFRLVVTDGEIVRISAREQNADLTARWRLVTAAATAAPSCGSFRSGESDCGPLPAGEYTLQVSAASGTGSVTLHRQHLTGCRSTRLDCEQEVHDEIEPAGDVDLFRFGASKDERVRVTVRELAGTLDAEWRLLTLAGTRPGTCDTFRRSLAEDCGPLPAGEYQLQVRDEQGLRRGAYAVNLQRLTLGAACEVTDMLCDQTLHGDIDFVTDSDLYAFSVESGEVVRIVVDERGGPLVAEWRLLAHGGGPAAACWEFTTARAADCGPLPAGVYVLQVKDDVSRQTGVYEISLFNLVHLCSNCGNGVLTPGEECDPPGPCCSASCRFAAPGSVCRPASGVCDVSEACTGTSGLCPEDRLGDAGMPCRPAIDVCDEAEFCSGTNPACPPDGLLPVGTVCRPAAGECDQREVCMGREPACGPDVKRRTFCRAAAGPCDVAERCDGESDFCPADTLAPAGVVCRDAVDRCDVGERCIGTTPVCPTDQKVPLQCGDGCGDAREQCGEPGLPECGAGTTCDGCVCQPCVSARASCGVAGASSVGVGLGSDAEAPAAWAGTLHWDPAHLALVVIEPAPGLPAPTCAVDASAGRAACEGIGGTGGGGPEALARATFDTVDGRRTPTTIGFALAALTTAGGDGARLCPTSASCVTPQCASPTDCDDEDACTRDGCTGGQCVHEPRTGFEGADCEIAKVLQDISCGDRPLDAGVANMLFRRVRKIRLRLARAANTNDDVRRRKLLRRAERILVATQLRILHGGAPRACRAALAGRLEERRLILRRLEADLAR